MTGTLIPRGPVLDKAALSYWSRVRKITTVEVSLLSVGLNPNFGFQKSVDIDHPEIYSKRYVGKLRAASEIAEILSRQSEIADGGSTVLEWLDEFEALSLPSGKLSKFRSKKRYSEVDEVVSQKQQRSMLKLILAMAIDKYQYNPSANRNNATGAGPNSIHAALERANLTLDADTIRNYLREAAAELDSELES